MAMLTELAADRMALPSHRQHHQVLRLRLR